MTTASTTSGLSGPGLPGGGLGREVLHPEATEEIAALTELFREGSRITEPAELLKHFGVWFGRARPSDLFVSVSRRNMPAGAFKITRFLTHEDRQNVASRRPEDPWRSWDRLATRRGGLLGEIVVGDRPRLLADLDTSGDEHLGAFAGRIRSAMAVPAWDDGQALNWAVWLFEEPEPPGGKQFIDTVLQTSLMGLSTKNLVSKKQVEQLNARLRGEFERIANIQRTLLPQRTPKIPGLELATSYITSDEAGGDYYDFFPFRDGRWGLLIADVAGHGAAAATVMAMLRAILHCFEEPDPCPGRVMAFANRKLHQARIEGNFVTAFFGLLDPGSGELTWVRCGHNPPRLRRAAGGVFALDGAGGLPLGIVEELDVEPEQLTLDPGDELVLYTDGITESMDDGRTLFGTERLDDAVAGRDSCTPDGTIAAIYRALHEFTGEMRRDDDQTLVIVRRVPEGSDRCLPGGGPGAAS